MCPATNTIGKTFKKVTHVIFDMDGLLLDTERLYTKAVQNVLDNYGKLYEQSVKAEIMGLTGAEASKKIVKQFNLPLDWTEYYQLAKEQYEIIMPDAQIISDTEGTYRCAISAVAQRYGKNYTEDVRQKVVGTVEKDTARIAIEQMHLPIGTDEFLRQMRAHAMKTFTVNTPLMKGAERLVRHLYDSGVPIAVATSSSDDSYSLKTRKHGDFFQLFHHTVRGGSDPQVENGKPSPDIFLVAAERFPQKPAPSDCLVFEDAPNGVKAALAAGMQVVMVPDENTPEHLCQDATLVLESLNDLQPQLFGLPAFK